jgi:hypothetical protein
MHGHCSRATADCASLHCTYLSGILQAFSELSLCAVWWCCSPPCGQRAFQGTACAAAIVRLGSYPRFVAGAAMRALPNTCVDRRVAIVVWLPCCFALQNLRTTSVYANGVTSVYDWVRHGCQFCNCLSSKAFLGRVYLTSSLGHT